MEINKKVKFQENMQREKTENGGGTLIKELT